MTHSQKRKLQRLRAKDKREQEAEWVFNETHPVYPQKKREPPQDAKTAAEAAAEASPDYLAASAALSDAPDCSTRRTVRCTFCSIPGTALGR